MADPVAGQTHDITIEIGTDVMGFMLAGSKQGPINPQSQRTNQAVLPVRFGNDPGRARGLESAWTIESLHHGIDRYLYREGDMRAYETDGKVDISREGFIKLASKWSSSDASAGTATAPMFVDFQTTGGKNYICMAAGTSLRVYDDADGLWHTANPGAPFAANAIYLFVHNDLLFVALNSAEFWVWTGATYTTGWSQPGVTPADFAARVFFRWRDELYAVGYSIAAGAPADEVYQVTDDGVTFTKITDGDIGDPKTQINHAWVQEDVILLGKPDGLHFHDGTTERNLWPEVPKSTLNFRMGAIFEGFGYTNMLDEIRKVTVEPGSNFGLIATDMEGDEAREVYGHGKPFWCWTGARSLYVAFDEGQGADPAHNYGEILKYNGIGWHQVLKTAVNVGLKAAGYSRMKGWLLYNAGGVTYRKRTVDLGEDEYPEYAASGEVVVPLYDAGMVDASKTAASLTFRTENCAAGRTVAVYRRKDEETAWTLIDTISSNGKQEISPGGIDPLAAERFQYKFVLATNDDGETPVVRLAMSTLLMVRSKLKMGHAYVLALGNVALRDGSQETNTSQDQKLFLKRAQNAAQTIIITNKWGEIFRTIATYLSIDWNYRAPSGNEEHGVEIRFHDTSSDWWPQSQAPLELTTPTVASYLSAQHAWYFDNTWNFGAWTFS